MSRPLGFARFALLVSLLVVVVMPVICSAQGFFYAEEMKDGRIYVFNNMKLYQDWKNGVDLEKRITRIGAGVNGETIIADSEEALQLYDFKHNMPAEVNIKPEEKKEEKEYQEKLPYKFSGIMFLDYYYNSSRDDNIANIPNKIAPSGEQDDNAFLVRRVYFTLDYDIAKNFATRFRLEADSSALSSNGKISVFVKDAYVKWKNVFAQSDLVFGMQPPPTYEVSEGKWAYRSLEKTIMDLRGIASSRDIGASLKGKLDKDGKYNYWVMFGNGSGNNPETDKFKRVYFHFHWNPTKKFDATIYYDYRALPDIADPNNASRMIGNSSKTTAWFAAYGEKDVYNIGYEGFYRTQDNAFTVGPAVMNKPTTGHSFWAWYNFNPLVGAVARFDTFDPNSDSLSEGDKRNFFIASLVVTPFKNVRIMPNVHVETYEDLTDGTTIKNSVTPRITFEAKW